MLAGSFSSDHPTHIFRWGRCLNLDGGDANSRWGDASPYNLSTGPNNVPAGRHHSSGPKEKGLRQTFRPFFGRIDGEDQKQKRSSPEIQAFSRPN